MYFEMVGKILYVRVLHREKKYRGGGKLGCGGGKCLYIFKSIIKTFLIMCKLLYDLFVFKTLTFNN